MPRPYGHGHGHGSAFAPVCGPPQTETRKDAPMHYRTDVLPRTFCRCCSHTSARAPAAKVTAPAAQA